MSTRIPLPCLVTASTPRSEDDEIVQPLTLSLRFQFGQCSVPTYFDGALQILRKNQDLFGDFIQKKISIDEAEEHYKLFEQNKIGKVVFTFE